MAVFVVVFLAVFLAVFGVVFLVVFVVVFAVVFGVVFLVFFVLIVFCLHNCSGYVEGKIVQVFRKICQGRKRASRKGFEAEAEKCSEIPFFYQGRFF